MGVESHSSDPRLRARALWLLARLREGGKFLEDALKDPDVNIRVTAIRAARQINMDMIALADQMMSDPSPFVWRELCLALQFEPTDKAVSILVKLADKYDGDDRWYLEAFGIGCSGREKQVLEAWEQDHPNADPKVAKGLAWRLNKVPTPDEVPEIGKTGELVVKPHVPTTAAPPPAFTLAASADPNKVFTTKDHKTLPPISELIKLTGNPDAGSKVFRNTHAANCIHCHQIGNDGAMIGPPLTVIGAKLNKGQLYQAILYPSASILMHYESWVVKTKSGDVLNGLLVEDTSDHVTIKDTDGKFHDIKTDDIDRKVMQKISLMPEGLNEAMTQRDLVNLVEYLSQQRP